jgi:hypothetical protein
MPTPVEIGDRNEAVVEELLDLLCNVVKCAAKLDDGMCHAALVQAIVAATVAVSTFRPDWLEEFITAWEEQHGKPVK